MMIQVRYIPDEDPYENDVIRIVEALARRGYAISHGDARAAWQKYSDSMAAGWMMLETDDYILLDRISPYIIQCAEPTPEPTR